MKKLLCLLAIFPLILTSCSPKSEEVSFVSFGNTFTTHYSDSYFLMSGEEYHQEIALCSMALAMSTVDGISDYAIRSNQMVELWEKEGFSNIYVNDSFKEEPGLDTIGIGIASKRIKKFNLVSITVRSGEYGGEWASNFTVGSTGHSKGFNEASETVLSSLKEYLINNNIIGHTKFWLSGYSRGGAVMNLTAAKLLDNIRAETFFDRVNTSKPDIYAYCFEPPAAASIEEDIASSALYSNIQNIINFNDLVPKILSYQWGFTRYGVDHFYPDRLTDINFDRTERKKLVSNYHFMQSGHLLPAYTVDDWKFYDAGEEATIEDNLPRESIHPSLGRFTRGLVNAMFSGAITRDVYAIKCEQGIREVIGAAMGFNPAIPAVALNGDLIVNLIFSYSYIQALFNEIQEDDSYGFARDLELLFYQIFEADDSNASVIKAMYDELFQFIYLIGKYIADRADILLQFFSRDNILMLVSPHYCELNYSFLMSCDTRFYGDEACKMNDGTYQILHVKTPNKVTIYENHFKEDIFVYQDGKMSSDTLSAEKLADGSLNIYLPKNGSYRYSTDSSSVTVGRVDSYGREHLANQLLGQEGEF